MPSTINGIGTTYYGKANLQSHSGVCEFLARAEKINLVGYFPYQFLRRTIEAIKS